MAWSPGVSFYRDMSRIVQGRQQELATQELQRLQAAQQLNNALTTMQAQNQMNIQAEGRAEQADIRREDRAVTAEQRAYELGLTRTGEEREADTKRMSAASSAFNKYLEENIGGLAPGTDDYSLKLNELKSAWKAQEMGAGRFAGDAIDFALKADDPGDLARSLQDRNLQNQLTRAKIGQADRSPGGSEGGSTGPGSAAAKRAVTSQVHRLLAAQQRNLMSSEGLGREDAGRKAAGQIDISGIPGATADMVQDWVNADFDISTYERGVTANKFFEQTEEEIGKNANEKAVELAGLTATNTLANFFIHKEDNRATDHPERIEMADQAMDWLASYAVASSTTASPELKKEAEAKMSRIIEGFANRDANDTSILIDLDFGDNLGFVKEEFGSFDKAKVGFRNELTNLAANVSFEDLYAHLARGHFADKRGNELNQLLEGSRAGYMAGLPESKADRDTAKRNRASASLDMALQGSGSSYLSAIGAAASGPLSQSLVANPDKAEVFDKQWMDLNDTEKNVVLASRLHAIAHKVNQPLSHHGMGGKVGPSKARTLLKEAFVSSGIGKRKDYEGAVNENPAWDLLVHKRRFISTSLNWDGKDSQVMFGDRASVLRYYNSLHPDQREAWDKLRESISEAMVNAGTAKDRADAMQKVLDLEITAADEAIRGS